MNIDMLCFYKYTESSNSCYDEDLKIVVAIIRYWLSV